MTMFKIIKHSLENENKIYDSVSVLNELTWSLKEKQK